MAAKVATFSFIVFLRACVLFHTRARIIFTLDRDVNLLAFLYKVLFFQFYVTNFAVFLTRPQNIYSPLSNIMRTDRNFDLFLSIRSTFRPADYRSKAVIYLELFLSNILIY